MKCIWKTAMGGCVEEEGKTKKCQPLFCIHGHQVKVMLVLAFIFIITVIVSNLPN